MFVQQDGFREINSEHVCVSLKQRTEGNLKGLTPNQYAYRTSAVTSSILLGSWQIIMRSPCFKSHSLSFNVTYLTIAKMFYNNVNLMLPRLLSIYSRFIKENKIFANWYLFKLMLPFYSHTLYLLIHNVIMCIKSVYKTDLKIHYWIFARTIELFVLVFFYLCLTTHNFIYNL